MRVSNSKLPADGSVPFKACTTTSPEIINLIANEGKLRKSKLASQMLTNRNSRFERKGTIRGIIRQDRSCCEKPSRRRGLLAMERKTVTRFSFPGPKGRYTTRECSKGGCISSIVIPSGPEMYATIVPHRGPAGIGCGEPFTAHPAVSTRAIDMRISVTVKAI